METTRRYEQRDAKRVYYLSMEFLIGRSLANNVTNLLVEPIARELTGKKGVDWLEILEEEPDAGLGNGGLGRLVGAGGGVTGAPQAVRRNSATITKFKRAEIVFFICWRNNNKSY